MFILTCRLTLPSCQRSRNIPFPLLMRPHTTWIRPVQYSPQLGIVVLDRYLAFIQYNKKGGGLDVLTGASQTESTRTFKLIESHCEFGFRVLDPVSLVDDDARPRKGI